MGKDYINKFVFVAENGDEFEVWKEADEQVAAVSITTVDGDFALMELSLEKAGALAEVLRALAAAQEAAA